MSETPREALERARKHARAAMLEGLKAAMAMLEAGAQAGGIDPKELTDLVGELVRGLGQVIAAVHRGERFELPPEVTKPLDAALAAEIERWRRRSKTDPDARPILRAFLGLRALLRQIDVGRPDATGDAAADRSPRAQRFDDEG